MVTFKREQQEGEEGVNALPSVLQDMGSNQETLVCVLTLGGVVCGMWSRANGEMRN